MPPNELDFERVLQALEAEGVRFLLVGGLAMVVHGSAYITRDVDVIYAPNVPNLEALARTLRRLSASREMCLPSLLSCSRRCWEAEPTALETEAGSLDLLGGTGAGTFEELWERSSEVEFRGHWIPVASLEDLIRMKEIAGRPKDQLHLMELRALQKIKAESNGLNVHPHSLPWGAWRWAARRRRSPRAAFP